MNSVIEEIYYGKRGFSEKIDAGEEYKKIKQEYCKIYDELEKGLNEKQKKILDELFVLSGGLEGAFACSHFKEGFKMGMLIASEVFGK